MKEPIDRSLTEAEAADFLGVSQITLKKLRCVGSIPGQMDPPPYFRYGGRAIRYSLADLEAYRAAHRVEPGED
jgi:hypothetical protein